MNSILNCYQNIGLLVDKGVHLRNVFHTKPLMCIIFEDTNFALDILEETIGKEF